jgi:hypothetical protein
MSSRFKPPSAEELARRGIGAKTEKVRARNDDGTLKADDPSTPENEAWTTKVVKKATSRKKAAPKKKG